MTVTDDRRARARTRPAPHPDTRGRVACRRGPAGPVGTVAAARARARAPSPCSRACPSCTPTPAVTCRPGRSAGSCTPTPGCSRPGCSRINGARLLSLRSGSVEHYSAAFFLTNPELPGLPANEFGIRRLRSVGSQLRERIEVWCFAREPERLEIRLLGRQRLRRPVRDQGRRPRPVGRRSCAPTSRRVGADVHLPNGDFAAQTRVEVSPPGDPGRGRRPGVGAGAGRRRDLVGGHHRAVRRSARDWVVPAHTGFGETGGEEPRQDDATARWYRRGARRCRPTRDLLRQHRRADRARPAGPAGGDAPGRARRGPARGRPAVVPDRLRPGHADHRVPVRLLRTAAGPRGAAASSPRCRARSATTSRTRSRARSCTRSGRAS